MAPASLSVPAQRPCGPHLPLATPCPSRVRHTAHTRPQAAGLPPGAQKVLARCAEAAAERGPAGRRPGGVWAPGAGAREKGRGAGPFKAEECAAAGRGRGRGSPALLAATHRQGGGVFPGEPQSAGAFPMVGWGGGGGQWGPGQPGKGVCLGRSFLSSEAAGPQGASSSRTPPHARAPRPSYSRGELLSTRPSTAFFHSQRRACCTHRFLRGWKRPRALGQVTLQVPSVPSPAQGGWW